MWRSTGGLAKGSFRGTARRMPERTGGEEVEMVLAVRDMAQEPEWVKEDITASLWVQSHRNLVGSESPGKTGTVVRVGC